jgi:hypothetical protein
MKEKVSELRSLQRSLVSRCVKGPANRENPDEKHFTPWNKDVLGYRIRYFTFLDTTIIFHRFTDRAMSLMSRF